MIRQCRQGHTFEYDRNDYQELNGYKVVYCPSCKCECYIAKL